ncbi:MAG: B12-binding domain-containing radical SAM protein [Candidatus Omnitrophica bacterium CG1_02_44_16]|nr:MAG: B12-binding domain-containing radical SAM protein [Candidatus Omnitrophica bacterium CG1_02_44_16]
MKIAIAYPPLNAKKGAPLLSQNRQFQYFKEPTYIYPVVPAQAATLLKKAGHEVFWIDGIAEGISYEDFLKRVIDIKPDVIAMETKTPVVKQHWKIINDLKKLCTINYKLLTILFGDHVTALPQESFDNSKVDFVLTGGDHDFLLLSLCNSINHELSTINYASLEPGIWYRDNGVVKNTGAFKLDHDLNSIPFIDRDLAKWQLYAFKNGNFKRTPGTYIMSGRDCWWGKCKFCSWPTLYPRFRSRRSENVVNEIGSLVERYGVSEIMDDTGTFPIGDWLDDFCSIMMHRGLNKKVAIDCNMRFGALSLAEYKKMRQAGFRLVLFGLESANQKTLDRIDKNLKVEDIIGSCRAAREAGLYPHITIMFGYPWETYDEALNTLKLGRWLLKKGFAYTVQATVVIPYPGSKLFEECRKDGTLGTLNWDDYDMKQPVMKSPINDAQMMGLVRGIYNVAFNPEFIFNRLRSVRDMSDLAYFGRGTKKILGHIFDFEHHNVSRRRI